MAAVRAVSILALAAIWSSSQAAYAQGRAYVANFGSDNVSVIDTSNNTVIATVMVGTQPQGIAVTPDGASVYVANCGGDVWVIDTASNKVATKFLAGACPTGVAITPDGTRAYVTLDNANSVAVIDTSSNTVITKIPVGIAPGGIAITPDGTRVYVANVGTGSSSVSVIDTSSNTVGATVALGNVGSVGVAITPDGKRAYVTNALGSVSVIDTSTNTVVDTVTVANVGDSPVGVAVTPGWNASLCGDLRPQRYGAHRGDGYVNQYDLQYGERRHRAHWGGH
ncbi:MAG TPA: YncE family protein [Bryobacteraceae bacterium]